MHFLAERFSIFRSTQLRIIDLGCGVGGYGEWLSKQLRCDLIGVDFSKAALSAGKKHTETSRAKFVLCTFEKMPFLAGSFHAAISLDALYLSENLATALMETASILKKGSPLIFTGLSASAVESHTNVFSDWGRILHETGFQAACIEEQTISWRTYMTKKHKHRWHLRETILANLGKMAVPDLQVSAAMLGIGAAAGVIDRTERISIRAIKV